MQITTKISSTKNGQHKIRGQKLTDLITQHSFPEVIFLLWRGDLPKPKEAKFLNALLVAAVDHGAEVPSAFVPRVVTSVGNDMHTALAAGMLSIGTHHGGAIHACADILASKDTPEQIVTDHLAIKKPIPGLGHRVYKTADPRTTALYKKAKALKVKTNYFDKAYALEAELKKQKNKTIPVNIDGALAAGLLDLGFSPNLAPALFLLSRFVGIAAHIKEEQDQKNPYYRLT